MKFTFAPESRPLNGFTIKRAIYRGGFGEVYYAISDAGREVALKLLQHNAEIEIRGVQQCLNLSHPNLVTIFDIKKDGEGDQWIIMEFVSGDTLDHVIRQHPEGVPIEIIRKWLPGIAAGVTYLHSRGIVHRDLKPANIFSEAGVVKIGDVGLSKFIAPSKRSAQTQSVGTVYYMAPEVAKGRYGREVDTYALGVILFEMLTGQLPFDGESTGEILMKHLSEEPDLTKLPPRLRGVIGKALHKDPQKRHKSIAEFERLFTDAVLGRAQPLDIPQESFHTEAKPTTNHDQPVDVPLANEPRSVAHTVERNVRTFVKTSPIMTYIVWPVLLAIPIIVLEVLLLCGVIGTNFNRVSATAILLTSGVLAYLYLTRSASIDTTSTKHHPRHLYGRKSKPSPWTGLLSSAFLTVPFTGILTAALALFKPSLFENLNGLPSLDPAGLAFFSTTAVVASWLILAVPQVGSWFGKRWQESRLSYALAGLVTGAMAFVLNDYLMFLMPLQSSSNSAAFQHIGEHALVSQTAGPTLAGYMVFFAGLLSVRNWYSQINVAREQRFSIGTVVWSVFIGWFVTTLFAFPSNWAMAWALIISCVVQLASPWNGDSKQRGIARR